ncbi:MAG: ankyrin repeat domain-containing protein [Pseudomonadales bacterium]|nr:ankyrin repeat domain-containing protein [Pseudomonadales bacterium]
MLSTNILAILRQVSAHPDFANVDPLVLHSVNQFGNSPIHLVAGWSEPEILAYLIKSGANVNQVGEGGLTPLHIAVENNDLASVKVLLSSGAELLRDDWSITPLDLAENLKLSEIAKWLHANAIT